MHLVSSYALQSGQKISKIQILEKFFPLPFKDYITLQPFSRGGKSYSYWSSVLELIHPILEAESIKIVQLGAAGEAALPGCVHLQGQTNIGQTSFLIKHAKLHLGCDSFQIHLAGHFDIPLVGLYSNCNYPENVTPFFGDRRKQKIIKCNNKGLKPSFAADESPKSIDTIFPETVADAVCSLLRIPFNYPYRTVFIGGNHQNTAIEIVPNQIIRIDGLPVNHLVVRMDYEFHEPNLAEQLKLNKCTIITDRAINMDLIRAFKPQIQEIIYIVKKENQPEFPVQVRHTGIPFRLVSYLSEEELNPLKLDYFDIGLILPVGPRIPEELKDLNSFYYKSSKFTLSNQKIYNSKYDLLNDRPANSFADNWKTFDKNNPRADDFFTEIDNFHILVDKEDKNP